MEKNLSIAPSEAIYQTISSSAHVEGTTSSTSKNPEVNDFSCAMADGQSGSQDMLDRSAVKSLKHYQNVKAPTTGAKEF